MKNWVFVSSMVLFIGCSKESSKPVTNVITPPIVVEQKSEPEIVSSICPPEMTNVHGQYCPKVKQQCLDWIDDETLPYARCRRYKNPSECLVDRVEMNYCINTEEVHDNFGMPYGNKSWTECKAVCENLGERLCNEAEFNLACEGSDMHPYPYGNGFVFNTTSCNIERTNLVCGKEICDLRANISEFPECISTFGIHNLVGNIDEWIWTPLYHSRINKRASYHSALSGGHFGGGRHRCRPKTVEHSEHFINPPTTGCRCCKTI